MSSKHVRVSQARQEQLSQANLGRKSQHDMLDLNYRQQQQNHQYITDDELQNIRASKSADLSKIKRNTNEKDQNEREQSCQAGTNPAFSAYRASNIFKTMKSPVISENRSSSVISQTYKLIKQNKGLGNHEGEQRRHDNIKLLKDMR